MRHRNRSFLLVTVLLLALPAVGFTCELASALCGPEGSGKSGVEALPCHGMPDMAMDCCSVQAPAEQPPAASPVSTELQGAMPSLVSQTNVSLGLTEAPESSASSPPGSKPGRHALLSVYLL